MIPDALPTREEIVWMLDKARRETASDAQNRWCRNATVILDAALAEPPTG